MAENKKKKKTIFWTRKIVKMQGPREYFKSIINFFLVFLKSRLYTGFIKKGKYEPDSFSSLSSDVLSDAITGGPESSSGLLGLHTRRWSIPSAFFNMLAAFEIKKDEWNWDDNQNKQQNFQVF